MAVTDLTGTKWVFNSSITATAGYGIFSLEAEDTDVGSGVWTTLYVGYNTAWSERPTPVANVVQWMPYIARPTGEFTITGGTDVTNSLLISWLEANATQIIETTSSTYIGSSPLDKCYVGSDEVQKIYVGDELVYEKKSSTTIISFTIDSTTYQAEEGMTWAEWVDSAYNTDGFSISSNGFLVNATYDYVGIVICDYSQAETTTIISNQAYIIFPANACD